MSSRKRRKTTSIRDPANSQKLSSPASQENKIGVVSNTVFVRLRKTPAFKDDNVLVNLPAKTKVTIIGESGVGNKKFYQVSVDYNGEKLFGYIHHPFLILLD